MGVAQSLHPRASLSASGATELEFTVLQIADTHYTGDSSFRCSDPPPCTEANTTAFIEALLTKVKPDLVVFTGDQVENDLLQHVKAAIDASIRRVIAHKVPWAFVFGNHDEGASMPRRAMFDYMVQQPYAVARRGPDDVGGVGNYALNVTDASNATVFRMYFLDTRNTDEAIAPAQVAYLRAAAPPTPLAPAVLFHHIPLPEYQLGWMDKLFHKYVGHRGETISSGPQAGVLNALVQMGDVKAAFAGHDHLNSYCIERKGIQLCYGGGVGYGQAYGNPSVARAARMIQWRRDDRAETITTWRHVDDIEATTTVRMTLYASCSSSSMTRTMVVLPALLVAIVLSL
ncbi:hypothetical protein SPRG_12885 [Saprolegnia parasitica CBS 223.65]|uniref:Calcineurin-like phosphoesterase domain-containing protein n=1 Tax=Saprolegnia parasitica (strain CBS 223.65) TaxID=695850 RepID=A0A067BT09_SAPPC|nr:hypothetical protein SPRG_12885 [Saprolegnia parasitica CBS 223.65]KDO21644.1 hypothetical protein SPRG_12885 [Saprolegnia parasitica CBS 223.65]|eukprot:XP_012207656.1 hypothetical protein SPRG_12885 [Saprolegnia parasitica CBS 223.65]